MTFKVPKALLNLFTPSQFDNSTAPATTAFVQRALGSARAFSNKTSGSTLTVDDVGKQIDFNTGGAATVSLPDAATCASGSILKIDCASGSVTVSPFAGNSITINNGPTGDVIIQAGDHATFLRVSSTLWVVYEGSTQLPYSSLFAKSLSASGYQKFPSGLIFQWGTSAISAGANVPQAFSLPITFPNAGLKGIASSLSAASYAGATNISTTQITLFASNNTASIMWLAIGY